MADQLYTIGEVSKIDMDALIEKSTLKDLLNIDFNDDYTNIARTQTALKLLYNVVMELDKKIKNLERKNG